MMYSELSSTAMKADRDIHSQQPTKNDAMDLPPRTENARHKAPVQHAFLVESHWRIELTPIATPTPPCSCWKVEAPTGRKKPW